MRYVDIGIPANNKGKHSIGCLFWLLARMVLQMRGTIRPGSRWEVMIKAQENMICGQYLHEVNHSFIVIRNWGGVLWAAISGIKDGTSKDEENNSNNNMEVESNLEGDLEEN
ncbi:40S ribosomal protein SA-like isoform X2 [Quercus lobata]|uniref:40S ribosomal protein SA-like isoform X2 n=1 Tax=Quercus lobata TaxID=97700 RepID=UPI001245F3E3|nr:40S ribosomal protein SA-like isoform X2 [Quercus lobata]